MRLQCGKGEPGEGSPYLERQATSWSVAAMKGSRTGADCAERCGIDVVENEPIDLQRENVEIETVNLTVLTNSLTAANLHNIISILSFVLFHVAIDANRANTGASTFSRGQ